MERLNIPTDFFYGAIEFEQINHKICAYDLNPRPLLIADLLNLFFDGWMPPKTRITDIVAAGRLLKSLQNCDVVVATSSGCACALGFWKKLGFRSSELVGIHCGIVNCEHDRWRQQSARVLLKTMKPVLFADNEIAEMRRQFCAERLFSADFGVDESYWCPGASGNMRSGVLSVGNDGRRDYETLLEAAALLPDLPFKIITRVSLGADLPSNVEHIHGDWKADAVSDEVLREHYRSAACVVVPLKESAQPSGQSVAMQAMMCGATVVMTRTAGWWCGDVLRSGEHLLEVPLKNPTFLAAAIQVACQSRFKARKALLGASWTTTGFARRLEKVVAE